LGRTQGFAPMLFSQPQVIGSIVSAVPKAADQTQLIAA
jgi:hypothetical protein